MANWKKIIVSGSNAHLNQITASGTFKLTSASHSDINTPLVIDSNGNVFTGSKYALSSGGNTVGGSSLAANIALIGVDNTSLIQTASSTKEVNFNSATLKGAGSTTVGSLSSSAGILFSGSNNVIKKYSISTNFSGSILNITASNISASSNVIAANLTDTSLTSGRVVFAGTNGVLSDDSDLTFSTDTLTVKKIDNVDAQKHITSSGNITASGFIVGKSITASNGYKIGTNELAKFKGSELHIGDNVTTVISASSLMLSASGGITASVVPETIRPPFFLGQRESGEIIKVALNNAGNVGGSSGNLSGVDAGTNINISNAQTTSEDVLIATKISASNGVSSITGSDSNINTNNSSYLTGLTSNDNIKIKFSDGQEQTIGVTSFSNTVGGASNLFGIKLDGNVTINPVQGGFIHTLFKVVSTNTGVPTVNVDNIPLFTGITSSGNLIFSGSSGTTFEISPTGSTKLNITASSISASSIDVTGDVNAGSFSIDAIQIIANQSVVISGSNVFGSQSINTHQFTGSLFVSGNVKVNGSGNSRFIGNGSGLTNLPAAQLTGTIPNSVFVVNLTGSGLVSQSGQIDGANIDNNTISGIVLGNNLANLTADNTNLKLDSGTTYNGGTAKTISAKTASITNGESALASGDQIHSFVTTQLGNYLTSNNPTFTGNLTVGSAQLSETELEILDGADLSTDHLNNLSGSTSNIQSQINALSSQTNPTFQGEITLQEEGNPSNTSALNVNELGILEGALVTTTELNILDGALLSTAELNILSGSDVTVSEFNILDGITATTSELNILDGVTVDASHLNSTLTSSGNNTIDGNVTIGGTNNLTVGGNTDIAGNLDVTGNLTVLGTTTTISSQELQIEDRFILIGSGSATNANFSGNTDVGVIFETKKTSNGQGIGTALYHDASDDRLNVARGVPANIGSNQVASSVSNGIETGHIVTVRSTQSLGSNLNTTTNKAGTAGSGDVIFGEGEMVIDSANDIWIYTV